MQDFFSSACLYIVQAISTIWLLRSMFFQCVFDIRSKGVDVVAKSLHLLKPAKIMCWFPVQTKAASGFFCFCFFPVTSSTLLMN